MAMRTLYIPAEGIEAWDQFGAAAAEAKLSTSALLMMLVRAYLDGKITLRTEVVTVEPS